MGLIDRAKSFLQSDVTKEAIHEMTVVRPEGNDDLIWRHPDQMIPELAQCTVRADEWAVFCRDGRPVGTLDVGHCTLSANDVSFLTNLVDRQTGGNFLATDLFFVRRASFAVPVCGVLGSVADPLTNVRLHPRCAGVVSVTIINPESLLFQAFAMDWKRDQRSIVEGAARAVHSDIIAAALRLATEQQRTIPDALNDTAEMAVALKHEAIATRECGLAVAAISALTCELLPIEEEALLLAMRRRQHAVNEAERPGGDGLMPPLVRQIFDRGLQEGELKGKRDVLVRMLTQIGVTLSDEQRARIQACQSVTTLDRWIDRILKSEVGPDVLA